MIEMNYLVLPQPIQALEGDGYVTRLDAGVRGVRTIEAGPYGVVVTTTRGDQLIFTAAGYGTPTFAPALKPTPLKFHTPSPSKHAPAKPKKKPKPKKAPQNPVPPPPHVLARQAAATAAHAQKPPKPPKEKPPQTDKPAQSDPALP